MNDELERLFAYAFQAGGQRRLLEEDLVRLLAHERHWLAPSRVRVLVQTARDRGILRAAGAHAFEISAESREISLPIDFRPDLSAVDAKLGVGGPESEAPLFRRIVRSVARATQSSESDVVAAVNRLQQEHGFLLTAETAAFLLARLRDVDIGPLAEELERSFQRPPKAKGPK